ncbi:hypothetical protein FQ775_06810 [Nitratireductor mangrovi]|uniref:Uncharacterized protein n=1 Tax=Nitratireductor mangrovi TaxID=2599600 RepID=A0A5B8KWR3_9HYPH|nr:hypothetical protein [Nitratireductor mangrovi]QDZ00114.1 hypothetical protein FQ775_06810 [Nitratireductor mangrovi]
MAKLPQFDGIEYLVRRRHPDGCLSLPAVDSSSRLSPAQRGAKALADTYRAELRALPTSELQRLVDDERAVEADEARQKAVADETARPFNRPDARADFKYWAKASYWTVEEAVALSLGRDPRFASWDYLKTLAATSPFAVEYAAKRELVMRAKTMGQLWDQTSPSTFLAWADRMRFAMPVELVEAVTALGIQICDWRTLYEQQKTFTDQAREELAKERAAHAAALQDHSESLAKSRDQQAELTEGYKRLLDKKDAVLAERDEQIARCQARIGELEAAATTIAEKSLGTKERDSLLRMVGGMAVGGYGLTPTEGRHRQTKEIADDLERAGVPIDVDTVRKYLAEAKQLLPGEEPSKD